MSTPESTRRAKFLGLAFDRLGRREAVAWIACRGRTSSFAYVVTPNVDHLVRLHAPGVERALWQAYESASLCLCDSRVLQLLAKRSGIALPLVPGSDLTKDLLEDLDDAPRSFAVIGGDRLLIERLKAKHPSPEWHHHRPPMGVRSDPVAQAAIIEFVESCPADIFFFAIGSPQSELVCADIARRGRAKGVALCVGASLEFIAGAKRRAPRWMQRLALEWLFRLLSEPGRLWRRYLMEGPAIFRIWWRYRIKAGRDCEECDSSSSDAM